jgi:hypothetical protein
MKTIEELRQELTQREVDALVTVNERLNRIEVMLDQVHLMLGRSQATLDRMCLSLTGKA